MAWSDPTSLKFDVSKISEMRSKLKTTSDGLSNLSKDLLEKINDLKGDWRTPAGKVFFDKFDNGWADEVQKYIGIIDAVDQLLSVAEGNYANVEEEVNKISF